MIILAISDLHIKNDSDMDSIMKMTKKLVDAFNLYNKSKNCIILTLGDIIDKGDVIGYENAKVVYNYLKEYIPNCKFAFVPGNHDLDTCEESDYGDFKAFDNFINNYVEGGRQEFNRNNVYTICLGNFVLLLLNSINKDNRNEVIVDYDSLYCTCSNLKSFNKVLATHYGLVSKKEKNEKFIPSQDQMMKFTSSQSVKLFLHGHEHYKKNLENYNMFSMDMIGVGPAFELRWADYPQFNIININNATCELKNNSVFINREGIKGNYILESSGQNTNTYDSIKYSEPLNYIQRQVSVVTNENEKYDTTLIELLKKENKVVLLADAGKGKSYELQKLVSDLADTVDDKVVFLYNARNYKGEDIENLIPIEYSQYEIEDIIFIIDGYDEILNQNANIFTNKINDFSSRNNDTKIVISTRTNFYQNRSEFFPGTFEEFVECTIKPFSDDDIKLYCKNCNVSEDFIDVAKSNRIVELLENPFYLSRLVSYYQANKNLPSKDNVMEILVDYTLCNDDYKYKYKNDANKKAMLLSLVKKLAFIMQSKLIFTISEEEIINWFENKEIELLCCCGLLKRSENKIRFIHNNFREYLTAAYISKYSFDTILKFISIPELRILKPSWLNVTSYLSTYEKFQNDLLNWISHYQADKICLFESDKLPKDIKKRSYETIINKAITEGMWIFHLVPSIKEFANFVDTKEAVLRLKSKIQNSENYWEIVNSIVVISYKNNLFGLDNNLCKIIVYKICNSKEIMVKIEGLDALERLDLLNKSTLSYIIANSEFKTERFYSHVTYYLLKKDLAVENLQFILQCYIDRKKPWYESESSIDMDFKIICESLKDYNTLALIFKTFSENEISIYNQNKIIENLIKNSIEIYKKQPNNYLFNSISEFLISISSKFDYKILDTVKMFFIETNTVKILYQLIIDNPINQPEMFIIFRNLLDEECLTDLSNKYSSESTHKFDIFEQIVLEMDEGENKTHFLKLIKEKTGRELKPQVYQDYSSVRQKQMQLYFDSLFNETQYDDLVEQFFSNVDENLTREQIADYRFKNFESNASPRFDLERIKWDIYHQIKDNIAIAEFKKLKRNSYYYMSKVEKILEESSSKKYIKVSNPQRKMIFEYCIDLLNEIDFDKEIECEPTSTSVSYRTCLLAAFSSRFKFKYDDKYVDCLIQIPPSYYGNMDNCVSKYFVENYEGSVIDNAVSKIPENKIVGQIALMIISYYKDKNSDQASKIANMVLENSDYLYSERSKAMEYLMDFYHSCEIISSYIDRCIVDDDLILILDDLFPKSELVTEKLIELNKVSETKTKYLTRLLKRNSEYALKEYILLCKAKNGIPEEIDTNRVAELTSSIRCIDDPKLINLLIDLLNIRYGKGFSDENTFGLKEALNVAFKNIAKKDYISVKEALTKIIEITHDNKELLTFCNYIILNNDKDIGVEYEKPLDDDQIKRYL